MNDHIKQALAKGIRLDGRKLDEFRPITIEKSVSSTAEGSARVMCGDSDLIGGVKLDLGKPFPDRPDSGALMVNAELRPISNPEFEAGPPSIESIETSRVIDRTIRESGAIDEKKLCVEAGEKVWIVNVDLVPLNTDGNLIDLGCLAAVVALKEAKLPTIKDGQPDYKEKKEGLPLGELPLAVTIAKVGDHLIVDPTQEEFEAADSRLTVGSLPDGTLCALQKGGQGPLSADEVGTMTDLALEVAKKLWKQVNA